MRIKRVLEESYIDYPGKVASVVFTPACNYKCPGCHAKHLLNSDNLIHEKGFFDYLDSAKPWIEAVVLTGGEPSIERGLEKFIKKIKAMDFQVKLDSNASNPKKLLRLRKKRLIDYVAMDIKAPAYLYEEATNKKNFLKKIEQSMKIVTGFPDYEFRTTVAPIIRKDYIRFLNEKEAEDLVKWIVNITSENNHKYFLQKFVPRKNGLIDARLEPFPETSDELIEKIHRKVIKYLPQTKIR